MIAKLEAAGKNFRQPIMEVDVVSRAVVKQILSQNGGQVILPPSASSATVLRALPIWLQNFLRGRASADLKHLRDWQKSQLAQTK
jgi:hypothetical protein